MKTNTTAYDTPASSLAIPIKDAVHPLMIGLDPDLKDNKTRFP
jgi:hypothetical protein